MEAIILLNIVAVDVLMKERLFKYKGCRCPIEVVEDDVFMLNELHVFIDSSSIVVAISMQILILLCTNRFELSVLNLRVPGTGIGYGCQSIK